MRLDDYERWLEQQFVEESPDLHSAAEAAREPRAMPEIEYTPINFAPLPVAPPAVRPSAPAAPLEMEEEADAIPSLDQYIPLLRPQPPVEAVEPEPSVISDAAPEHRAEELSEDAAASPADPPEESVLPERPDAPAAHFAAARLVRIVTAPALGPVPPLSPEEFWALSPRQLPLLMALGAEEEVHGRSFKEARVQLIERLLDPGQPLADTARLFDVRPVTVRPLRRRAVLEHLPPAEETRRFRLADALAFLEGRSRA